MQYVKRAGCCLFSRRASFTTTRSTTPGTRASSGSNFTLPASGRSSPWRGTSSWSSVRPSSSAERTSYHAQWRPSLTSTGSSSPTTRPSSRWPSSISVSWAQSPAWSSPYSRAWPRSAVTARTRPARCLSRPPRRGWARRCFTGLRRRLKPTESTTLSWRATLTTWACLCPNWQTFSRSSAMFLELYGRPCPSLAGTPRLQSPAESPPSIPSGQGSPRPMRRSWTRRGGQWGRRGLERRRGRFPPTNGNKLAMLQSLSAQYFQKLTNFYQCFSVCFFFLFYPFHLFLQLSFHLLKVSWLYFQKRIYWLLEWKGF